MTIVKKTTRRADAIFSGSGSIEHLSNSYFESEDEVSAITNISLVGPEDDRSNNVVRRSRARTTIRPDAALDRPSEANYQHLLEIKETLAEILACIFADVLEADKLDVPVASERALTKHFKQLDI